MTYSSQPQPDQNQLAVPADQNQEMVLSFLRKLFAFLSSVWALADIALSSVTVYRFHTLCQHGTISCAYYQLGILFMLLPVIFAMAFIGIILVMESGEFGWWCPSCPSGLLPGICLGWESLRTGPRKLRWSRCSRCSSILVRPIPV